MPLTDTAKEEIAALEKLIDTFVEDQDNNAVWRLLQYCEQFLSTEAKAEAENLAAGWVTQYSGLQQHRLAFMFTQIGWLTTWDKTTSAAYFKTAAETDNPSAQCSLALCYHQGWGVDENLTAAYQGYTQAAKQGYVSAEVNLGVCYEMGMGIERNLSEALKCCRKAAAHQNALAQLNLGIYYELGMGVDKDFTQAIRWYKEAAKQGHTSAQQKLGTLMLLRDKASTHAFSWLLAAAKQGNASAQSSVGACYSQGLGGQPINHILAFEWYGKSVKQGSVSGLLNLAQAYEMGIGVMQDKIEAKKYYIRAIIAPHVDNTIMHVLALTAIKRFYEEGEGGLPMSTHCAAICHHLIIRLKRSGAISPSYLAHVFKTPEDALSVRYHAVKDAAELGKLLQTAPETLVYLQKELQLVTPEPREKKDWQQLQSTVIKNHVAHLSGNPTIDSFLNELRTQWALQLITEGETPLALTQVKATQIPFSLTTYPTVQVYPSLCTQPTAPQLTWIHLPAAQGKALMDKILLNYHLNPSFQDIQFPVLSDAAQQALITGYNTGTTPKKVIDELKVAPSVMNAWGKALDAMKAPSVMVTDESTSPSAKRRKVP
jgi:TPR repeat protein